MAFNANPATTEAPGALIGLVNGDVLPAAIESLDATELTVTSPDLGRLVIPRASLASIQLGLQDYKEVYSGPKSLDEWTGDADESKNWLFQRDQLVANGPATAAKKLDLPRQFILRFTLGWEPKQIPNFQVSFADPLKAKGEPSDRYYLQFGAAGLEIKREASQGKRYNTIVLLNRTPNQYPDRKLQVEIRVDRRAARLQLLLNGEPEGEFVDPIPSLPDGSGITLVCNTRSGSSQEIGNIEVLEFDDSRGRHRSEERGDPKTDSLISREDDRWGGHLLDIRSTNDGPVFRFKSDFQEEPLEIPEADVSTVFFAASSDIAAKGKDQPFVLRLAGEGACRWPPASSPENRHRPSTVC